VAVIVVLVEACDTCPCTVVCVLGSVCEDLRTAACVMQQSSGVLHNTYASKHSASYAVLTVNHCCVCVTAGDSDDAIVAKLSGAVKLKKAALGGHSSASDIASHSSDNRPMILIGG
jgi:hypothetical protein